jgi:hypothetical protein
MLKTQTPRGFTVPPNQPSTLVDRDAPDLELEIIEKLLPLLADRAFSLFDLADIAGLPFSQLADLLESERVTRAYNSMLRILAIRQKFLDAQPTSPRQPNSWPSPTPNPWTPKKPTNPAKPPTNSKHSADPPPSPTGEVAGAA